MGIFRFSNCKSREKVSDETNTFVDPKLSERELQIKLVFKGDDDYYRVVLEQK